MSRRMLNNLGATKPLPTPQLPENPFELVKPKPIQVQHFIPNEPIILTKEQWNAICEKTYDATAPFTVSVTVIDKNEEEEEEKEEETPYVPKRGRKSKK